MNNESFFQIALSITPNVSVVKARMLIEHFGSAANIFKATRKELLALENVGSIVADSIKNFSDHALVEEEMAFMQKYGIQPIFLTDEAYPKRLLNCYDPPTVLYYKGNADLNAAKIVSIIGTRSYTPYGREMAENIIAALADKNILIVSGLAAGIDIIAHKTSLENNMTTVGVMGNGLKTVYPSAHKNIAARMLDKGGLLTEFTHKTLPDKHNFPRRNRIVAGLSDAVIVVETSLKGGSMITAEIANGYSRDIFAVPGRPTDLKSAGCNYLIQNNKAILFSTADDFLMMMGWDDAENSKKQKKQNELFYTLTEEEKVITDLLQQKETTHIDEITALSGFTSSKLAALILQLELQNIIRSLPGKMYGLY